MKLLFIPLVFLFLASCKMETQKAEDSNSQISVDSSRVQEMQKNKRSPIKLSPSFQKIENEVDSVLHIFFSEVALERVRPQIKINTEGYYQLAFEEYIKQLDSLGIFDSSFFQDERIRLEVCMNDLSKMQVTKEDSVDGIWEPRSCHADYLYWLSAQDEPESYVIKDGKILDKKVKTEIRFVNIYDGKTTFWDNVLLNVELKKDGNHFIIKKVERVNLNDN